ncbi:MAG: hypothetical protein AB7W16_14190 [Candidatus Obscuribacterales bacterium]
MVSNPAIDPTYLTMICDALTELDSIVSEILTFAGYQMDEEGNIVAQEAGKMFHASAEAERRAQSLNQAVKARRLHPDLLIAVRPEYMSESGYFRVSRRGHRYFQESLADEPGRRPGSSGPDLFFPSPDRSGKTLALTWIAQTGSAGARISSWICVFSLLERVGQEASLAYDPETLSFLCLTILSCN